MDKEPQSSTLPFTRLLAAPRGEPVALLHSGQEGRILWFAEPLDVLRLEAAEWRGAFDRLEDFLAKHRDAHCAGFLGYDLRDDVEAIPRRLLDDHPLPCLHVTAFRRREESRCRGAVPAPPFAHVAAGLRAHTTRSDYEHRIEVVVEHIRAGDIFQANLTQPFTARFEGDPRALFWQLCHASPAPFAAYYETGHPETEALLSSSPEEFLWVAGDHVRTRPIKGTRPRGATRAEDDALLRELLASEKDQAELAMIVDLLRNDLGKHAVPGSVRVGAFPEHETYAQVHHTFATVEARLLQGVTLVDVLRGAFPCGSITGAPKLRAMEILEDLELVRRGVYTGAIGWFGPGPRMHLNVAIRTVAIRGDTLRFNTGGGITADSDPHLEYDETLHKAEGIVRALGTKLAVPQ